MRNKNFKNCQDMLRIFEDALADDDPWYEGVPQLELALEPILVCDTSTANYIDSTEGQSGIYMALVRRKDETPPP